MQSNPVKHTISLIGPGPGFDPGYAMTTDPDVL
jgi:hypothetical protein